MAGPPVLGIIAGRGALPGVIAEAAEDQGRRVVLAVMDGAEPEETGRTTIPFRVERLGGLFAALRRENVSEVVFAGAVARPALDPRRFDLKTAWLARKFLPAMRQGDDALLRVVIGLFEAEGFTVRGAHELVPGLVAAPEVLTRTAPDKAARADAARAMALLRMLGPADLGQSAVVARGQPLAVEAAPGTDVMLAQVAALPADRRPPGGVFAKAPKPGQERRIDLPTIGPQTVAGVAKAGLAGLVIEAGGVIVLEREAVIGACDAAGLFLWAREADG
ncbi:MAG: UDP-2,3-diacylglucosamine diphosphatase LpxI [Rhodobacteraceae bacterium]|nr:UDP-2,3-diacylglucosamine diphosphatase LpxI [Paracoccaceae bacterium]